MKEHVQLEHRFDKIDELPFDFSRRRMSVVLATRQLGTALSVPAMTKPALSLTHGDSLER